jgi:PiT family inorganic phosphate transporter
MIFGALAGAMVWNLITWWGGIALSSSHALVGARVGADVTRAGLSAIVWSGLSRTLYPIGRLPVAGVMLGVPPVLLANWLIVCSNPAFVDGFVRRLRLLTVALFSLDHVSVDARKVSGVIAVLLNANGSLREFAEPSSIILSCCMDMGHGTMWRGWCIVHTMGSWFI